MGRMIPQLCEQLVSRCRRNPSGNKPGGPDVEHLTTTRKTEAYVFGMLLPYACWWPTGEVIKWDLPGRTTDTVISWSGHHLAVTWKYGEKFNYDALRPPDVFPLQEDWLLYKSGLKRKVDCFGFFCIGRYMLLPQPVLNNAYLPQGQEAKWDIAS